jgi:uncharacterized membrane protein YraQ (UPF0718 family)
MFGLITGLLRDAVTPILDRIADASARLIRKIVLFAVAGVCAIVVLIALTNAFDLWITTLAGPIVGALAVAGLYLAIAIVAVVVALRDESAPKKAAAPATEAASDTRPDPSEAAARIDQFTAPIMDMLQRYGFKREQLAVFAGATLAKRLGPLPLVGCAIVAGFLAGRMWKSWRHLLETALAASPLLADILGQAMPRADADEPEPSRAEAAE